MTAVIFEIHEIVTRPRRVRALVEEATQRSGRRVRVPVERLTLVARDVRLVERVTGRRGYPQAASEGMVAGAVVGGVFGWFFGLLDWVHPLATALALAVWGALLGALVGAFVGVVAHLLSGRRRECRHRDPRRWVWPVHSATCRRASHSSSA